MTKKKPSTKTQDSFVNFVAKLGQTANNQHAASSYSVNPITRNRTILEFMYRGSWIIRAAVDILAEDMTKAGVEFTNGLTPKQVDQLSNRMVDLKIWDSICNSLRWARLFGGCIAVMLIDGQKMSTPLNLKSIGKDQFKGLLVLDRWMLQPSYSKFVKELGPHLGLPEVYQVVGDTRGLPNEEIHYSRVLRFEGLELPYYQKQAENGWGESIVETVYDRLTMFDSTSLGAGQLAYKAHIRTYSIEKLRELIVAGGKGLEAVLKQIELIRLMQGNEGLTILDATDKFEAHQYTFAGLSDLILQFGQQIAGAIQTPLVRLFGQSPAGLNSSGDSDLRTHYDNVKRKQETDLRQPMGMLLDVMIRSELGIEPPDDFTFNFLPLWEMSDQEKADIAQKDGQTIGDAFDRGLVSAATAMTELRQSSRVTGRFNNITDEEISDAESLPPKLEMQAEQFEMQQQAGAEQIAAGDKEPKANK